MTLPNSSKIAPDILALNVASLPRDLRERLVNKFFTFKEDREKIHRRMESYVLDFQLYDRTRGATQRHGELEERYSVDAPKLTHLVFREGGETALWDMRDIAIVLGRSPSSVTRVFQRMRGHAGFAGRVKPLSVTPEHPGRNAAALYEEGIFDAIVDYYEHAYLEHIIRPRHGTPLTDEACEAVRAFWRGLKNCRSEDVKEYMEASTASAGAAENACFFPTLYSCLRMILRRVFSVRAGTCFLLLFGILWEMCRRWPWLDMAVPVVSITGLAAALAAMFRRRGYTPWLADAGACAVMSCLLWTLTLFIEDSPLNRLMHRAPVQRVLCDEPFVPRASDGRIESVKRSMESDSSWIKFSNGKERTSVEVDLGIWIMRDGIEKILYGVDTETPDEEYHPSERIVRDREALRAKEMEAERVKGGRLTFDERSEIMFSTSELRLYRSGKRVGFVSAQIVFKDGTSTPVRIFRNNSP